MINILQAMSDPKLFGNHFDDPDTWKAWTSFLAALFGLPMDQKQRQIYESCTNRTKPPTAPVQEAWLAVGRRGGKSRISALIAVFLATFRDYEPHLAPGEVATVMVIAGDRKQARAVMGYIRGLIDTNMLSQLIIRQTAESIELNNRVNIEIHTASFRAVRGYTLAGVVCDEIAFWRSDESSANPDSQILAALRPATLTIPGAMLLGISSPYARRGELWSAYQRHFGDDTSPVLVWQAASQLMNPSLPKDFIDREYEKDPVSAAAEYGAQFRTDVSGFLNPDWLESAVVTSRHEFPPQPNTKYFAFADPSGGRKDRFTLAIAHAEDERLVLDLCRGKKPPFDPSDVVTEFSEILKRYRCNMVTGDRYAAEWVVSAFKNRGINYQHSEKPKSEIYLEAEPLFSTGQVDLLDHSRLLNELRLLERRTSRSGRDSVDHAPGGHDDLANAACGALVNTTFADKRVLKVVKLQGTAYSEGWNFY